MATEIREQEPNIEELKQDAMKKAEEIIEVQAEELPLDIPETPAADEVTIIKEPEQIVLPSPLIFEEIEDEPPSQKQKRWFPLILSASLVIILVAASISAVLLQPAISLWLGPVQAGITIIPQSQSIESAGPVQLAQISGHSLQAIQLSDSLTRPTTGHINQPAQAGAGTIVLYNASPSGQTIPAGTLITGQDGATVTTDETAFIAGANPPTEGSKAVSAHSTEIGPSGNIPAFDINGPCCRNNVFAKNFQAFTGGQEARSYQAVAQSDIDGAASQLKASLLAQAQSRFLSTLSNGEKAFAPDCKDQISSSPGVGGEAQSVKITVSLNCQDTAYNDSEMQSLALAQLQAKAPAGYRVVVQKLAFDSKLLHLVGQAIYDFSRQAQLHLARLVAGKSIQQAYGLLMQQPGISNVAISLNKGSLLPSDPGAIHFFF